MDLVKLASSTVFLSFSLSTTQAYAEILQNSTSNNPRPVREEDSQSNFYPIFQALALRREDLIPEVYTPPEGFNWDQPRQNKRNGNSNICSAKTYLARSRARHG